MNPNANAPATRSDLLFAVLFAALLVMLWWVRGVLVIAAFALLLAYILDPLANLLGRIPWPRGRHMPRAMAAVLVVLIAGGVLGTLAAFAIPLAVSQAAAFVQHLPEQVDALVDTLRAQAIASGQGASIDTAIDAAREQARTALPQLAGAALRAIGGLFARLDQVLTLGVLPVLTYYLLADSESVRA